MRIEDMVLVSVDDHVVEPANLFDRHIPPRHKERAPRMVKSAAGDDMWAFEGQLLPNPGLNAVAGRPPEEYGFEPTRLSQMRKGCYDVHARIGDMNANGVLASMCFPRHRLDPVLPRALRLHLPAPPRLDAPGLRREAAERRVPRARAHLLHRRRRRRRAAPGDRAREHHLGVRLPALGRHLAALARDAGTLAHGRARRRGGPDDARQRDALVPARLVRPARAAELTVGVLRAQAKGVDLSLLRGQGGKPPSASRRPVTMADTMAQLAGALDGQASPARR